MLHILTDEREGVFASEGSPQQGVAPVKARAAHYVSSVGGQKFSSRTKRGRETGERLWPSSASWATEGGSTPAKQPHRSKKRERPQGQNGL